MTPTKEQSMVTAHQTGRKHATAVFNELLGQGRVRFTSADEQASFLAGCIGELRRLAADRLPKRMLVTRG